MLSLVCAWPGAISIVLFCSMVAGPGPESFCSPASVVVELEDGWWSEEASPASQSLAAHRRGYRVTAH